MLAMNRFARMAVIGIVATIVSLPASATERKVPESAAEVTLSFAPIVKRVVPAVVNVYASRTVEQRLSPFFSDPFFRRFFGDGVTGPRQRQRVQRSLGSGVIVDPSGILVTNHHVIENADAIKVTLSDRREFDCDVILMDERTDLAVLRIRGDGETFPHVEFSDSDAVTVGDLVLAIGDPFGVGQTVTSGIVSALSRTEVGVSDYQFFIQTDAAINPGNSGGALIGMDGRLIGINTAIFSRSGGSNGIGFAIPSNMVRVVVESAEQGGHVRLPWVGATFQEVTADLADGLGIERPRGVLIVKIHPASPAERARLAIGDLVVTVDGFEVNDPKSLNYRLATKGIGAEVRIGIIRSGKEYFAVLPLEPAPETVPRDPVEITSGSPLAGATVLNLSPAVAEELAYRGDPEGVIVSEVARGSRAARTGIKPGDVILDINGLSIESTRQLVAATSESARLWNMTIERDGRILRSRING
jgi:Do/DeqQ family serine protease